MAVVVILATSVVAPIVSAVTALVDTVIITSIPSSLR
jgi:hypothetical protein